MVKGDFDKDNNEDIIAACAHTESISVLLGNGDGTFELDGSYFAGGKAPRVAVGRLNSDEYDDLAITRDDWFGDLDAVAIMLGNGDGTFQAPVDYEAGDYPLGVAVGLFDSDAHADLAVANRRDDDVSVLLGNGDGTFQAAVSYLAGDNPAEVAVGRLNADLFDDLVVLNETSRDISILLGNGDGTFQAPVAYGPGNQPHDVAIADFDDDGADDLAVCVSSYYVKIFFGNGDGTFQTPPVAYEVGWVPISITARDLDNDTDLDLAVACRQSNDVSILLGNGDGTFELQGLYGVGADAMCVVAGDFDENGLADLAAAGQNANAVFVLLGTGYDSPVEGAFFAVADGSESVQLRWTVGSLAGIDGFRVYRATSADGPFVCLNEIPFPSTSPGGFVDATIWPGTTFWYELRAVLSDGSEDIVGSPVRITTGGSFEARLYPARPNPFGGAVTMQLDVPNHSGPVVAAIYNVRGQLVKWLEQGPLPRGRHTLQWDGTDERGLPVSNGVYFCQARVGEWTGKRQLVLLR
jgi:hypothetical protein